MLWGTGSIEGYVCHIITIQWFDATIHIVGTAGIAMETHVREVGLHQSRLHVGNTHLGVSHVNTQSIRDGLHSRLGSTIHVATRIGSIASHTTDVDDMTMVSSHHPRHNETGHGEQALDIGINHLIPIIKISLILRFQTTSQSGIVDEHINLSPIQRDVIHRLLGSITVAHIEGKCQHLDASTFQLFLQDFQLTGVSTSKNQIVAALSKATCASLAYSAGCASNKSNFIHVFCYFELYD